MADIDKPILQVIEAYKTAVHAKDAQAFMRLYDPGVRVFDTWGVWSYEGVAAWHSAVEAWFTSLGGNKVRVGFDDLRASGGKELAHVSAIVTYTEQSAEGQALRAMQNRLSWVLKTSGHVPRIVHEHTSAPVGFEDMKAILQRSGKS